VIRCVCGGILEVLSVPFEMWVKCEKCGNIYVFPYGSSEWKKMWVLRELKRIETDMPRFKFDIKSLMEKFENLRKDILNLLEKEVEKLKGDLNV